MKRPKRKRLQTHGQAAPRQIGPPPLKEQLDIAVVGVESLYPDPTYIDREEFYDTAGYRVAFGSGGPTVTIAHRALDTATAFANVHQEVEVGGLCFGRVFRSPKDEELLIRIEEMIPAEHTVAGAAFVTFTYESWQQLLDVHKHNFPELRLLGWFHSHPGFGIFLSPMDRFIHDGFFATPWHVAVVIDPLQQQVGTFVRSSAGLLRADVCRWADNLHLAQQSPQNNTFVQVEKQ